MRALTCLLASAAILVTTAPAALAATPSETAVDQVAKAERDFDADTFKHGITRGFYTWSLPGAVAFRPGPVDIHARLAEKLKANPKDFDAPAKLRWGPWRIGAAKSGDFAYDIGTWHLEGAPNQGWFFTLWQKSGGKWRWALDMGAGDAPDGEKPDPAAVVLPDPVAANSAATAGAAKIEVGGADSDLNGKLTADLTAGYADYISDDGAFGRAVGAVELPGEAGKADWEGRPKGATWTAQKTWIARSNDLACVQGEVKTGDKVEGYYVRVWQRKGPAPSDWRLSVDLFQPVGS